MRKQHSEAPAATSAPSDLHQLQSPADYVSTRPNVWPSLASFDWFMRRYRAELVKGGAVVNISRNILIDSSRCDAVVLKVGRERARRS